MVLGNYYLTMEEEGREGEGMVFKDIDEAVMAYRNGYVHLHSRVGIAVDSMPDKPWKENQLHKILVTTVGKILFNSILVTSSLKPSNVFVRLKHQPSLTV